MIPYGHQSIDERDIESVVKVLQSDWITQGPSIDQFEKSLAEYCGAKFAVAVNNGTTALHVAYLAAGLKPGDEVITTSTTFVATSNMVLACGAKPVFCDIRLDTNNIDEDKIEKLITRRTKMIVPVHLAGQPCNMKKILKIAKKYKLKVVEDAAHALGASYQGKKIGSLQSDMTTFSFHPVKSITTGEGGAILTNSKKLYNKMRLLRTHGIVKNAQGFIEMKTFGYNYRITDFQAALGINQMKKLDTFIAKRQQIVVRYEEELQGCEQIILPQEVTGSKSSWHIYVIRVKNPKHRLPLINFLKSKGIGVNFHYPPVYSHPFYKRIIKCKDKDFPETTKYAKSAITIPCYQDLSQKEAVFITEAIKEFFRLK